MFDFFFGKALAADAVRDVGSAHSVPDEKAYLEAHPSEGALYPQELSL